MLSVSQYAAIAVGGRRRRGTRAAPNEECVCRLSRRDRVRCLVGDAGAVAGVERSTSAACDRCGGDRRDDGGGAFVHFRPRKSTHDSSDIIDQPGPSDATDFVPERLPKRLRLEPAWGRSPLWDDETGEPVIPYMLGLPYELAGRIDQWDVGSYDHDEPMATRFKVDAAAEAYRAEGLEIVAASVRPFVVSGASRVRGCRRGGYIWRRRGA